MIRTANDPRRLGLCASVFGLALAAATTTGCMVVSTGLRSPRGPLVEKTLRPARGWRTSEKIVSIDISGIIAMRDASLFSSREGTVGQLREALNLVAADDDVVAVILRIDSPGGGVTASDLCYHEIVRFKEDLAKSRGKPIPVVAALMGTAASGGYYIAMAADEVWALPTTVTGSIGVITTLPQIGGLAEKIGLGVRVIKSGDKKDIGSMWRDLTADEREIFQSLIDSMYDRFVEVVVRGRPDLAEADVRGLADGRIYTARQALDARLIDDIGYLEQVIEATRNRAGVEDAAVVTYAYAGDKKSSLYSTSDAPTPAAGPGVFTIDARGLPRLQAPRFYYLWLP